ncbi:SgcJ/EcaC family oxidoreductase [Streptomyces sp. URMC 123]|uniref:SgcJ/EcaC family oxidoreductase n=1 Tax=Streptomyces sp. URMC 123 TaxID=3423403 RepID=UPI003F19A643
MTERPTAARPMPDERDARAIEEVIASLEEGFNAKDAAILDRWFTADAVTIVPNGTILRGWDELFPYHSARLAGPVKDWSTAFSVLDIAFLGPDTALVNTRQETTTPDGGFANHGTCVLVRKDGQWWLAAMHQTNVVAPGK